MKRAGAGKDQLAALGACSSLRAGQGPREGRWPGASAKPVCPCRPSPPATAPRAAAAPPFSGPRSRGATRAHRPAASSRPKRATSHDTANGASARGHHHRPAATEVARHVAGCHCGAGAGGSGYGRRPHSRCHGSSRAWTALMALRAVDPIGCPASVGRRTYPGHLPSRSPWPACSDERRQSAESRPTLLIQCCAFHPKPAEPEPNRQYDHRRTDSGVIDHGCDDVD